MMIAQDLWYIWGFLDDHAKDRNKERKELREKGGGRRGGGQTILCLPTSYYRGPAPPRSYITVLCIDYAF